MIGAALLLGAAAGVALPTRAADPPGLFLSPFEPKPIDPDAAPTVAAASFLEAAAPLPDPTRGKAVALASTGPLIADQEIQPIDLAAALRLCGARDLDVAIARARMAAAAADLQHARALWLPSIFIGPNWIRHDGQAQVVEGPVRTISKSSLFLGATAAGGSSITGPVPAGGPAPVTGLTTVLRISDAIFLPLAARQIVDARRAGIRTAANDALLGTAESYMELQRAAGRLAIAREAAANAAELVAVTDAFVRAGAGLEGDHQRSLAERDRRLADVEQAVGALEVASADLVRRTRLDPLVVVAPVEPAEAVLRVVADDALLDDLVATGLRNRPELAEARALVEETLIRLRQARLRPFVPSVAFRYSGGGFGGGRDEFFGDFASRSDADVNLYWETANLGFTDRAIRERRGAERRVADLGFLKVQDRVAAEVVQAEKARIAARRQLERMKETTAAAVRSVDLNLATIRRAAGLPVAATRPIEVLQPIQALAQARTEYLDAVIDYNVAQFRLEHALGRPPVAGSIEEPAAAAVETVARPEARGDAN
ncbi:MAG: TolC family protein [Planctomycetes bacterium]|nr:TolC family protein [Planctomycetota bacterium]